MTEDFVVFLCVLSIVAAFLAAAAYLTDSIYPSNRRLNKEREYLRWMALRNK